ncbi:MAG: hypothetical protein JNK35_01990 [Phycisphaerae bacterium]|nr:hypothetical protein [Phycisphaerae bacterium]
MPASRSRTERWRDLLDQLAARGGALEIALSQGGIVEPHADLVWRVRILDLDEKSIAVESPSVAGRTLKVQPGTELIGTINVGQNRWMFVTRAQGYKVCRSRFGGEVAGLTLDMPVHVERCTRRQFYRMSAAQVTLPDVQVWPLLDPASVVAAETANKALVLEAMTPGFNPAGAPGEPDSPESILLPQVGPVFQAKLQNVSGGGLGLVLNPGEASAADRYHAFWLRIDLRPQIPVPVAVSARRVHCHLDSNGQTYAGMAFDFTFNPSHQKFVTELFTRYIEDLQSRQRTRTTQAAAA